MEETTEKRWIELDDCNTNCPTVPREYVWTVVLFAPDLRLGDLYCISLWLCLVLISSTLGSSCSPFPLPRSPWLPSATMHIPALMPVHDTTQVHNASTLQHAHFLPDHPPLNDERMPDETIYAASMSPKTQPTASALLHYCSIPHPRLYAVVPPHCHILVAYNAIDEQFDMSVANPHLAPNL